MSRGKELVKNTAIVAVGQVCTKFLSFFLLPFYTAVLSTEDYGIAPADVESTRRFYNKKRSGYFRANTGNEWKDLKNYDIVLDSSKLGIEGCVNILRGVFE